MIDEKQSSIRFEIVKTFSNHLKLIFSPDIISIKETNYFTNWVLIPIFLVTEAFVLVLCLITRIVIIAE